MCLLEKLLQAAQALHRAKAIDPDHPELHVRIVDLKHTGQSDFFLDSRRC